MLSYLVVVALLLPLVLCADHNKTRSSNRNRTRVKTTTTKKFYDPKIEAIVTQEWDEQRFGQLTQGTFSLYNKNDISLFVHEFTHGIELNNDKIYEEKFCNFLVMHRLLTKGIVFNYKNHSDKEDIKDSWQILYSYRGKNYTTPSKFYCNIEDHDQGIFIGVIHKNHNEFSIRKTGGVTEIFSLVTKQT